MISIAMATYNGERFIREQIDSIINQSYKDFELIICDDCSKDSTPLILKEYEDKDSRVHVYINESNLGFKKNFGKAISLCKGDYIALSDQDDIWSTDHIEKLYENIEDNILICANSTIANAEGVSVGANLKGNNYYISNNTEEQFIQLLHKNYVQGCTVLFERSLVDYLLPIPEEQDYHDCWLGLVASLHGKIKYIPDSVLTYRQHGNNITKNEKKNFLKKIHTFFERYNEEYKIILKRNKSLYDLDLTEKQKEILIETNSFLRASLAPCFRFKYIKHFFKYYNLIYFTENKKLLCLRFIKKFILCL